MTNVTVQPDKPNPAQVASTTNAEPERIPMSLPTQRLSVPEIPGFHLHWFLGAPDRLMRARQAGYTFVEDHEVGLANRDIAGANLPIGGTDMGTRVSVVAGGTYEDSPMVAARLYLMKIPNELWEADQAALAQVNHRIAAAIRGETGLTAPGQDNSNRYRPENELKQKQTLFHPKH